MAHRRPAGFPIERLGSDRQGFLRLTDLQLVIRLSPAAQRFVFSEPARIRVAKSIKASSIRQDPVQAVVGMAIDRIPLPDGGPEFMKVPDALPHRLWNG